MLINVVDKKLMKNCMKCLEEEKEIAIPNNKMLFGINITQSLEDLNTLRLRINVAIISDNK